MPRPINAAALAAAALAAAWVCERNVPGRLHLRWPHLHLRVSQDAVGERIRPTRSGLTIDQCRLDCCNRARCIGFDHDSGTSSDGTGKCWASATSWAAKPLIDWTRPNSHRWACEAFVPPPPLPPSPPPPPLPVNVAVLQPRQCVTTADGVTQCIQIEEGKSLQDTRVQAMIERHFGSALA